MRKFVIGVMGGTKKCAASENAFKVGEAIAENNCILVTGACPGLPGEAASGAKSKNGFVIGISPAHDLKEHKERYELNEENLDIIIFTGFGFKGRNVINIRASDAIITIEGALGTLNEFTIAFDEGKLIGVLEGSGRVSDLLKELLERLGKETNGQVFFERNPKLLVEKIVQELKNRNSR